MCKPPDQEVRRLIYTTNTIEGFNRQLRKVTKSKSVFPTDDSLLKMLYLAMMDITKKWTGRRQDWSRIHAQLSIYFAERLPPHIKTALVLYLFGLYTKFGKDPKAVKELLDSSGWFRPREYVLSF